jgi:hypothetical protein
LRSFGLHLTGTPATRGDDTTHDVLTANVLPQANTEYAFEVDEVSNGEIIPCIKTSVFNDVAEFQQLEESNGEIIPCIRTFVQGEYAVFEHFEGDESAIIPCIKTTIEGDISLFEHFDPNFLDPCVRTTIEAELMTFEHFNLYDSEYVPCVKTSVVGKTTTFESFDPKAHDFPCWIATVKDQKDNTKTTITVNEPSIDFEVFVLGRRWILVDGELVERRDDRGDGDGS